MSTQICIASDENLHYHFQQPSGHPTPANSTLEMAGRKCSICSRDDVNEINSLIAKGVSFRGISRQLQDNDKLQASLQRHATNCLQYAIAAELERRKGKQAINVIKEFEEQLRVAKALREGMEEFLFNEQGAFRVQPWAQHHEVTYFDNTDLNSKGEPKKKTASLQNLLEAVATIAEMLRTEENVAFDDILPVIWRVDKVVYKGVDPWQYITTTIASVDTVLDKLAKTGGLYQKEAKNQKDVQNAVAAIQGYLQRFPTANRDQVIEVFTHGTGIAREDIVSQLGTIG